uniref:non-specific serine/threonine protein kinase n=1 Tax=Paramoeba aestuarina TaxID=180227 RepID=A0A7S4K7U5_9EUKA
MPNGNLETVLKDHQIQLSDRLKLSMARDCALGMNWLHKATPPILHRDLKPPNLLVDKDYTVKVCDFGLSCIRETDVIKDKDKVPGTPLYMSPEVLTKGNINEKCDVYSFGIVLWQIMTRQDPFPEFQDFNEFRSAICRKNVRPPIPSSVAQSVKSMMERSWNKSPSTRPSFEELIPMLEKAIMEVTIEESHSRKFWEDHGWGEEALWKHFSEALSTSLGLGKEAPDMIEWRVLKHMLTVVRDKNKVEPEHVVLQEKFGSVMDRFYPLKESKDYNVMTHLLETINTGWFHGDMERKGAEERLKGRETGTFLVRTSNTIRFNFTISKVDRDGRITHQRIEFHPKKGFSIIVRSKESNQKSVIHSQEDTLPEFVARLKQPLVLLIPCAGSLMEQFSKDTGLASLYLQGTDYY